MILQSQGYVDKEGGIGERDPGVGQYNKYLRTQIHASLGIITLLLFGLCWYEKCYDAGLDETKD